MANSGSIVISAGNENIMRYSNYSNRVKKDVLGFRVISHMSLSPCY